MKFSETMPVGYTRMQQEVREQNIEIKKWHNKMQKDI